MIARVSIPGTASSGSPSELCEVCEGRAFRTVLELSEPEATYRRCQECALVRVLTDLPEFDYSGKSYTHQIFLQSILGRPIWQHTLDQLEALGASGRLVEVGAGAGAQLHAARRRGFTVEGYDINPDFTVAARTVFDVRVRCEDFLEVTEMGTADVVVMHQLIEHVPNATGFFMAAYRLLRDGGLLAVSTPNWSFAAPFAAIARMTGTTMPSMDHIRPAQHIRLFESATIEELARRNGFDVERIVPNPTYLIEFDARLFPSHRRVVGELTRAAARVSGSRFYPNMLALLRKSAAGAPA